MNGNQPLSRFAHRTLHAARWRARQIEIARGGRRLLAAARLLGFPSHPYASVTRPARLGVVPPRPQQAAAPLVRKGVCGASVCTVDHLPFAYALASSFRRHHPELELYLLVVDGDGVEIPSVPGMVVLRGSEVGLFADPYLALKLSAFELCCAAKSFLLTHLAEASGHARAIYFDADVALFAPCDRLLDEMQRSPFVVFPHTLSPLPQPELWWERPWLGELALHGVLNAGLFGVDLGAVGQAFLRQWRELVSGPGAFQGLGQTEQNSFNWIIGFAEGVRVLRDPAYNVAYWNLHDRSLRYLGDGPEGPDLTVDGRPLVAFHFSGYAPDLPGQLSAHDARHPTHWDRALTELLRHYQREIEVHHPDRWRRRGYRFDRFPSGIRIDSRMRALFKEHEADLHREEDPFSPSGEAAYCRALLSPAAKTASLLPLLLSSILRERPDLQAFPDPDLDPFPLLRWFADHGVIETGYQQLFDAHRPVVPRASGVRSLLRARAQLPGAFSGLGEPLGRDRQALVARLEAARGAEAAGEVRRLDGEIFAISPLHVLRTLVEGRDDLHSLFPDLLDADAPAFANWLRMVGTHTDFIAPSMVDRFLRAAGGGALARIFSYVDRHPAAIANMPLALVGVGKEWLARGLLSGLNGNVEYDLDDVVMYLWLMEEKPWAGLPLTLELRVNAHRVPSPLLPEGQDSLLGPVLSDPRFRLALEDHRRLHGTVDSSDAARIRRWSEGWEGARRAAGDRARGRAEGCSPGVNLFGYFRSPIGLGTMSHGLAQALRSQTVEVRENVITNQTMGTELRPEDFVRRYDHSLSTNLFVSYPHLKERLLDGCPSHQVGPRHNVAYLAWEQREGNRAWAEAYQGFDQVWALSTFAARALQEAFGREVTAVPCVVDLTEPSAAEVECARERHGLAAARIAFLHTFDANSSVERKNPEAVVKAFARAFCRQDRALLVLRVSNADRREHRRRLGRLMAAASATGLDVRFVCEPLTRAEVLALAAAADCYVSLHRAEGFGLTCAEAMALGKPAIATRYSGNLDFMDDDNSLLVAAEEVEVGRADGPFRRGSLWAEPDVEHAAVLMRSVLADPESARALGVRARTVRERLSPQRVGRIACAALGRLWGPGAMRAEDPAATHVPEASRA